MEAINKVYKLDGRLWIGCYEERDKAFELHDTEDISEKYGFPNSFIYADGDAEWRSLRTTEEILEAQVIAVDYTCIKILEGWSTTYLYAKVDAIEKFLENKLKSCKNIQEYYTIIKKYGDILIAVEESKNA